MKILRWIIGLTSAVLIAAFVSINRETVTITWLPFAAPMDLPFYIPALACLGFGFLLGIITLSLHSQPFRSLNKKQKKEIQKLKAQISENL